MVLKDTSEDASDAGLEDREALGLSKAPWQLTSSSDPLWEDSSGVSSLSDDSVGVSLLSDDSPGVSSASDSSEEAHLESFWRWILRGCLLDVVVLTAGRGWAVVDRMAGLRKLVFFLKSS
jgi:hypothetical protein